MYYLSLFSVLKKVQVKSITGHENYGLDHQGWGLHPVLTSQNPLHLHHPQSHWLHELPGQKVYDYYRQQEIFGGLFFF